MATPFPFGSGNVLTAAQMNAITTLPINDQTASYTAVVGDVGKRIVMNVATANTVTIDDAIFGVGDTIFVANKGAGATTVTAGSGVTINTASGLVLVSNQSGQLVALSASSFLFVLSEGKSGGLVVVKDETPFTAATQVVCDDVFSSSFTAYKIVMRFTGTTGGAFGLKLRVAGVADSTNYNRQLVTANSTTVSGVRQTAQTSYGIAAGSTGNFMQSVECLLTGAALAEATTFLTNFQGSDAALTVPFVQTNFGNHSTATAFDGFELNAASGNFTGVYSVYGLAKTGA